MKYCGARYWVDYTLPKQSLKERVYVYEGVRLVGTEMAHIFKPYTQGRPGFAFSDRALQLAISYFRPFCIDPSELPSL